MNSPGRSGSGALVDEVPQRSVRQPDDQPQQSIERRPGDEAVARLAPGQRWSLARKREVVLRLMRGEPVEGVSRRLGVAVWKLERWRERALAGIDAGLREGDDDAKERELTEAHRRIGELSMENELLRARLEKPGPLARRRWR
jgi:transposase